MATTQQIINEANIDPSVKALLQVLYGSPAAQFNPVATGTPATLTAAQMVGASDNSINMTATLGGAGTLNTDTAANIISVMGATIGLSVNLRIINSSAGAFAWTLTAGVGV